MIQNRTQDTHRQTRVVKPVIYTSGSVTPFNVYYIEFGLLVFNV